MRPVAITLKSYRINFSVYFSVKYTTFISPALWLCSQYMEALLILVSLAGIIYPIHSIFESVVQYLRADLRRKVTSSLESQGLPAPSEGCLRTRSLSTKYVNNNNKKRSKKHFKLSMVLRFRVFKAIIKIIPRRPTSML